jgi:hypothetical protein
MEVRCVIAAILIAVCGAGCAPASRCRPVRGARVRVGGRSGTTDRRGRVTLTLQSKKAVSARAARAGYTAATKRLGVRR